MTPLFAFAFAFAFACVGSVAGMLKNFTSETNNFVSQTNPVNYLFDYA